MQGNDEQAKAINPHDTKKPTVWLGTSAPEVILPLTDASWSACRVRRSAFRTP